MTKQILIIAGLILLAFIPRPTGDPAIRVASKKFTESVILGEMLRIVSEDTGHPTQHLQEIGGTRILFESLRSGDIDAYVEYTGTLSNEIFAGQELTSRSDLSVALAEMGIGMSKPLGFNNTYALGMIADHAEAENVKTISDLAKKGGLNYGIGNEFFERADGWAGLRDRYRLAPATISALDHDIAWSQLRLGQIDVMDVYTTEARIDAFDMRVLDDDLEYFPRYDAVILYREATASEFPDATAAMKHLTGSLNEAGMTQLNRRVEIDGESEQSVAADFVEAKLHVVSEVSTPSRFRRIMAHTIDHLELVRRSLLPAILFAIPLGILSARSVWFGHICLAITGIFQTIPAFALLVLLLPVASALGLQSVGAGSATAIFALFLYSLLPIVRNTYSGLMSIDRSLIESAEVLNLPTMWRLLNIELPLASRSILAGIKTAAVMNIGFATLGALVGAGGYGQPILSGIRLARTSLILEGAIPAALLALAVQAGFELYERWRSRGKP